MTTGQPLGRWLARSSQVLQILGKMTPISSVLGETLYWLEQLAKLLVLRCLANASTLVRYRPRFNESVPNH